MGISRVMYHKHFISISEIATNQSLLYHLDIEELGKVATLLP